jgi:hypothetical protein
MVNEEIGLLRALSQIEKNEVYFTDEVLKAIRQDNIEVEIANCISDIDNGKVLLTPYEEGMNEMMERIKAKLYNVEIR